MKKKKIWALIICIVLFVLASLSVLFLVRNGKNKTVGEKGTETEANTDENTEVLLSFDSYEEITKAGLKIGNQFGETKINTEAAFITEGKGSWMIRPQGDYGKEGYYPYFRLRCTESSFAKSDFEAYDKLLLDVYNDSDEVIEMECILSATNAFDSYDSGETTTWTLKPNAWTACEYDLSGEEYSTALDLTEARYMNVTILSVKESKEDTVPTLYLDNLRGHISGETREHEEFACNFRETVTFETVSERYLFNAGTVGSNKVSLSRAAYENSVIGAQDEEFGEYGLQGTVQGATWPATTMRYNEELPAGTIISCKVYVAADEAEFGNATYYLEPSGCSVFNGKLKFNCWETVEFELQKAADSTWFFLNFDDGEGSSMFGGTTVTYFMDNFRILSKPEADFTEGVDLEEPLQRFLFNSVSLVKYEESSIGKQSATFGTYGLTRDLTNVTWPSFAVNFGTTYKKGDRASFMVYVEADERMTSEPYYYMGSWDVDIMNGKLKFNEWNQIEVVFKKDTEKASIFVNLDDGNEKNKLGASKATAYLDNFVVVEQATVRKNNDFSKGVDFEDSKSLSQYLFTYSERVKYSDTTLGMQGEEYGEYGLKRDGTGITWPSFYIDFCKEYPKGDVLTFMLYVEADETLAAGKHYYVGAYGHDVNNDKKEFNRWVEVQVPLKKAADTIGMFLNFDNGNQKSMFGDVKVTAYMDNFKVIDTSEVNKKNDFSKGVTFEDRDALTEYLFTSTGLVKYADTSLGKQSDAYGEYGIMRDGTKITWPSFYIDFCKEYPKGDVLTFMLYVEADETLAAGKHYYVGAYGHDVNNDKKEFNRWVEVQVPLKKAADTIGMFLNFDNGNQKSMFGDAKVTAYMDNFKVIDTSDVNKKNDFSAGVTFEDRAALAEYLFTSTGLVKYADTSLGKQSDTYGEYGIMRDGTKITWPSFYIDLCKEYEADDILSFMLYVDVDETLAEGKYFYIDAYGGHNVSNNKKEFNKWVQVNVPLKVAASKIGMFLNFDDGSEKPMFGGAKVVAYMDNFRIIKTEQISKNTNFEAGVTFEGEGMASQYLFANADFVKYVDTALGQQDEEFGTNGLTFDATGKNWPGFTVLDLGKTYPAGSRLCFRIYAQTDEALAKDLCFWVDNDDGTKHPFNQWTEGWVKVDGNSRYIFLNFEKALQTLGQGKITVYLDNFYITEGNFEEGITLENRAEKFMFSEKNVTYSLERLDGNMVMKFDSTNIKFPYVNVNFNKKYTGNAARLCFKIYVKADETLVKDQVFYVGADDGQKHPFNQWTEGWVKVTNADSKSIYLNFDKAISAAIGSAPITVYLDDFYVTEGKAENTLTFENPAEKYVFWKNNVTYTFEEFGAAGMAMKFVVNQNWPRFNMQVNSAYAEKKTLFFKIYAKVDEALLADEKYYVGNDDPNAHSFNQWEEGYIKIGANSNSASIFLNFEKALKTIGKDNITVYLDDFAIK